jgi:hypothetical protein
MRVGRISLTLAALVAPFTLSGCFILPIPGVTSNAPFSMGFATPTPVPAWVTERMEEKFCWDNDHKTTILPPIRPGFPPPVCEDPPDEAMILRAMPHVKRGIPYVVEEFRDDIEIVTERIVDKIDPGRFYPLIGPAQLHHCHWKCTIFYTMTCESGYPFPVRCRKQKVEVVYIDKDHLHLCPGPNPAALESVSRDLGNP